MLAAHAVVAKGKSLVVRVVVLVIGVVIGVLIVIVVNKVAEVTAVRSNCGRIGRWFIRHGKRSKTVSLIIVMIGAVRLGLLVVGAVALTVE